jgi:RND family efflux transporter MFP subunit
MLKLKYSIRHLLLASLVLPALLFADPMSVTTMAINKSDHYEVTRSYAGQLRHQRQSQLGFETPGTVNQVHVLEGDLVARGAILVSLDQAAIRAELKGALSDVETARARVNAQRAQLRLSEATLKRNQTLSSQGHVSDQLLDELAQQTEIQAANLNVVESSLIAASARAEQVAVKLAKTEIKAPYAARIQTRHLDEGSIVSPGTPVISLVENGNLEANIGFPEDMLGALKPGETYEFTVNKQQIPGRLKAILPRVDAANGTVTTQFILDADDLFGGSLAVLNLSVPVAAEGYWVPISALAESQRGLWSVLVVEPTSEGEHTVESRLVEILHRGDRAVYVRGTLRDGDLIVASGTGRIVPGQSVSIAQTQPGLTPGGS